MNAEEWGRVDELFQRAIGMPAGERNRFVEEEAKGDEALATEVLSLLSFDARTNGGLGMAVQAMAARMVEETEVTGQRIGIYRIVRKVGEGGMGSVYLGARDDGEFQKEVAIKIVRQGMESPQFLERFRRERQILANLDHPNVARILDGGEAHLPGRPVAVPYLVMEYVDGQPIHLHCREKELGIRERCGLFLRVCEAVAQAHRQLIVHRDIKPGNILVAADNTPKLLDFGIAYLIATPDAEETNGSRRQLTIDYASPEQVRGENAGVATDVYSLGAVFYELLTDVRPHQFRSYSAPEVERVICQEESLAPSRTDCNRAKELRGDLDAIVLKAMRKDPARRYGSVDELRGDIDRYLRDIPVEARAGGLGYRAGKFCRRHTWAVAGVAVAVCGLLGGTAGAVWQAHAATEARQRAEWATREAIQAHTTEQEQRQRAEQAATAAAAGQRAAQQAEAVAVAQKAEAEHRLGQVRELANRLLFEYQDEVAALPGSTAVRKKMVETGLAYFDSLARDRSLEPALRREMADGWRRLGDIQGNPYVSNLGDANQALASYDRALRMQPGLSDATVTALLVAKGDVLAVRGDFAAAEAQYDEAIRRLEKSGAPKGELFAAAIGHSADVLERRGKLAASFTLYQRAIAVAPPAMLATLHQKAGGLLIRMARPPEALDYLRRGLAHCDATAGDKGKDPRILRTRVWILMGLSDLYRSYRRVLNGKIGDSSGYIDQALETQERLRAVEPFNEMYTRDWAMIEQRAASTNLAEGRLPEAVRHGQKAVEAAEALGRLTPENPQTDLLLAVSLIRLARPMIDTKQFPEAEAAFARAEKALDSAAKRNVGEGAVLRERYYLSRDRYVLQATRTPDKPRLSLPMLREAIRLNEALLIREPNAAFFQADRAELHSDLAGLLADAGEKQEACTAYAAAYTYRAADKRPLRPSEIASFKALEEKLPECRRK